MSGMNDRAATASSPPDDSLARGDAAAEREDWPSAVRAWERALSGSRRDDAAARLQWFIAWRTGRPVERSAPAWPRKPLELFGAFLACSLFAVAAVFLTQDLTGALSDTAMVAAWLFIVAASTLALLYARYSEAAPAVAHRLGHRQAQALASRASALANGHAPTPRQH